MSRSGHGLRGRIRRQLRALDLEPPLRVEQLCVRFGEHRGRPIELRATPLPAELSGLTLVTDDRDLIVYQSETSRAHQHWVVTHELGHIMLGHEGESQVEGNVLGVWGRLMPDLPASHLQQALRRSCHDDGDERDAERTAQIIRGWATVLDHVYPAGFDRDTPRWIKSAFSERQGWL